ncbi:hypothetical protein PHAVU_002G316800 [Phaseolus vulgaris]|uniref:VQ motif-containing protein 20-like n=1 Tax=Phaseolus vulgaris TaxID=3885 RepID=UPI0035CB33B9
MTPKTGRVQGSLKISKESQWIKKSPVSKVQHKEPVIIYTQTPRIIQTHARHFMELVQKLTGICHSDLDDTGDADAFEPATPSLLEELEENEAAASVITEEEDSCNSVVFESEFLNANPNQPLLHFADPLLSL